MLAGVGGSSNWHMILCLKPSESGDMNPLESSECVKSFLIFTKRAVDQVKYL